MPRPEVVPEAVLNDRLRAFTDDTATLHRYLVDHEILGHPVRFGVRPSRGNSCGLNRSCAEAGETPQRRPFSSSSG
ncbi:DUF2087 domain-containing protein [Pseudactinotalea sp. Z1748]|uniref:DUF2087 domain-containing protein n=1 Tax=Pseudactinotalea sp. Z1748 TaxID=3413027 RepID=UPI003C7B7D55